jgi:polyvinyl alcohol dehydrogenase (cytochrome)
MVYGLDPDNRGQILWRHKLGEGYGGSVIWGPAADDSHIYVPRAGAKPGVPGEEPGVTAIRLATGERDWHAPAPQGACSWTADPCSAAQPAAASVIPGVVFAGSLDGHIRGYDTADGHIVWDFDTAQVFLAVNGGEARGGSIDGGGQTIANGLLYVNSGNTTNTTVHRGNALLAFSVDGQ